MGSQPEAFVVAGLALVGLAAGVRQKRCPHAGVGAWTQSIELLVLYVLVYRITDRVLPAVVGGGVYVVARAVETRRGDDRTAWASLLQVVATLCLLRVVAPSSATDASAIASVAAGIGGVVCLGLLFVLDIQASVAMVVSAAALTVVARDPRIVLLTALGFLAAALTSRGVVVRSLYGCTRGTESTTSSDPRWAQAIRVAGGNVFFLGLLLQPIPNAPWATLVYWSTLAIVGWAYLTALVAALRGFGPGLGYMRYSVWGSAFVLAIDVDQVGGAATAARLAWPLAIVLGLAALALGYRLLTTSVTTRRALAGLWVKHRAAIVSMLLFAAALRIFLGDLHYVPSGDTQPAELLPIALLQQHSLTFDGLVDPTQPLPYWFLSVHDRVVSSFPIVPGLMNVPSYVLPDILGADLLDSRGELSLVTSSTVAAASVVLMFVVLRNLFGLTSTAVLGAVVYAFATCVWSVAAKSMWQHGPSLLFMTGALALLTTGDRRWLLPTGLLMGLAVWNRPTNLVFAVAIGAYVAWRGRSWLPSYLVGMAFPLAGMLLYSWYFLGEIDTFGQAQSFSHFDGNVGTGLLGILLSPNRGLFVFSPIFLLSLVGLVTVVRRPREFALTLALSIASMVLIAAYARWFMWWGGWTFGYRLVIETIPALVILAAIGWERWACGRTWRVALVALLAGVSVSTNWLGATYYPCGFDSDTPVETHPELLWDVRTGELSRCAMLALEGGRG
jgi:hypothetical protein